MVQKTRVLLVDDHAILRDGLRALLGFYADIEIVGEASDGEQATTLAIELVPDVVIMDIAMPGMDGITATRMIKERCPNTHVLILTQYEDRQYVLALLEAGAAGYVLKRALGSDLITALRTVARGDTFLYPTVAGFVVDEAMHRSSKETPPDQDLTRREIEVLKLIALGRTNAEIAQTLVLSPKTVDWHRTNLMAKLDVHSAVDLARYAFRHHLVDPDT
jgi:DNA-binding NarL/FixJ family response regulator